MMQIMGASIPIFLLLIKYVVLTQTGGGMYHNVLFLQILLSISVFFILVNMNQLVIIQGQQ